MNEKAMISRRMNIPMYRQVSTKIRQVRTGQLSASEVTGSTTVRVAVGLALGCLSETNPTLPDDKMDAWERLNAIQRLAVQDHNPEFRSRGWTDVPVYCS